MAGKKFFGLLSAMALAASMSAACAQSDAGVTTAVKSKLVADETVKAYKIDVDTKNRVVTLKGEVDSEVARSRAVELAKSTEGVRDVVDSMVVAPGPAPTSGVGEAAREAGRDAKDAARDAGQAAKDAGRDAGNVLGDAGITSAVKTKMLADTDVSGLKIDVDTKDGVVTLSGNVSTATEKRRAVEIARETKGVKTVKDQLKIVKP
jgi:osmotically-inducible protein OsmY